MLWGVFVHERHGNHKAFDGLSFRPIQAWRIWLWKLCEPWIILGAMSQTLEKRVEDLEKKVAELSEKPNVSGRKKNPWRTFGIFKNDPDFEEAVRLGREYREQQTYEKEIAGS